MLMVEVADTRNLPINIISLNTMGPYEKVVCARTLESKARVWSRSLDPIDSIGWLLSITVGPISSC